MSTFGFRYDWSKPALAAMGLGRGSSSLQVEDGRLGVRMGWAFRMDAELSAVTEAELLDERGPRTVLWGIGVHGFGGHWRVNGSTSPIVRIRFEPRQRARTAGLPLKIHTLDVSPDDPEGFLAALARAG